MAMIPPLLASLFLPCLLEEKDIWWWLYFYLL